MADLFGLFNYYRPGPGVPENGKSRPAIVVFLGILKRKFVHLMQLNLLYVLFSLPAAALALIFISNFYFEANLNDPNAAFGIRFIFTAIILCIPVVSIGPVQAGFTFVLRNYSREEHAFIWHDFKESSRKNLKQGVIICTIDLLVMIFLGIVLSLYTSLIAYGVFSFVFQLILFMFLLLYMIMHLYMYQIMVTFKLSVKEIYKNAFMLAFAHFLPNLLIVILCIGIITLSFLNLYVGMCLFILITPSVIGLITNFYAHSKIKKYTDCNSKQH